MSSYNQSINQKIADKIKFIRKKTGLTQIDLASKMGISYQQIQKYENGDSKITVERLKQIADILKVSLDTFIVEDTVIDKIYKIKQEVETDGLFSFKELNTDEQMLIKLYRAIKDERIKKGLLCQLEGVLCGQELKSKKE